MRIVAFFFALLFTGGTCLAQSRFDIYYICIGSGIYKNNPSPAIRQWENIPDAEQSANVMASVLTQYGNAKGVTLISTKNQLFSKIAFENALNQIWDKMLNDKPVNPLLVIYYCGHGFSENLVNSQFLLGGDCSTMRLKENFEDMCKKSVFVPEIVKMLYDRSLKIKDVMAVPRYMLLLDCCRRAKQNDSLNKRLTNQHWQSQASNVELIFNSTTRRTVASYKYAEKYADPIVYASAEMTSASMVPVPATNLPLSIGKGESLGPLCRRTLLLLNQKMGKNASLIDIDTYVTELLEHDLDPQYDPPPTTPYTTGREGNSIFLVAEPPVPANFSAPAVPLSDWLGTWTGMQYYGIRKPKFPKSYGGVQSDPLPYESSKLVLTIDKMEGNRFRGSAVHYFQPDSALNHSRVLMTGEIVNGKMRIDDIKSLNKILTKYPGRYWVDTKTISDLSQSGDYYTLIGTSANAMYASGPYKLRKKAPNIVQAPPNKPADKPKADTGKIVDDNKVKALLSRSIISKQLVEVSSDSLVLKLYDDGEIDGDIVTVFINGKPIVEHQRLIATAFTIPINMKNWGYDVVITMVAENEGDIPPNTAFLTLKDGDITHELRVKTLLEGNSVIRLQKKKKQ